MNICEKNGVSNTESRLSVDLRTPISLWDLLIWAYKRQMVHYEGCDEPIGPDGYLHQASAFASMADLGIFHRSGGGGHWSINAAGTTSHPDAHTIHQRVMMLSPKESDLIIDSAAKGHPPDWDPYVEPLRVVPVRRGGGRLRLLYGKSNRPIGCLIDYEGVPDSEISQIKQAARESYELWWRLLKRLRLSLLVSKKKLSRWRITEIGAIPAPWDQPLDTGGKCLS